MISRNWIALRNHQHLVQCVISCGLILWKISAMKSQTWNISLITQFADARTSIHMEPVVNSFNKIIYCQLFVPMKHRMPGLNIYYLYIYHLLFITYCLYIGICFSICIFSICTFIICPLIICIFIIDMLLFIN